MKLGIFLMPLHPVGKALGPALREATRKALFVEELGFEEFWLGEHFSASSEPIPSPLMCMASLLPQTKRLRFGTGVINLPNRHPAVVAAEVAQFDHMAQGRFHFGIGPGSLPSDFELFAVGNEDERRRRVLESIDMITRIWRQEPPYIFDGEFWKFAIEKTVAPEFGFGFMPKPRTPQGPPIHVSTSGAQPGTAILAAERDWGPISSGLIAETSLANHWRGYSGALARLGKPVTGANWRVVRSILVAPTDEEARRRVFATAGCHRHYFAHLFQVMKRVNRLSTFLPRPDMSEADLTIEATLDARVIYGSPATVAERLDALREKIGPFDTLLVSGMDWSDDNEDWERESMTLLARDVVPRLRAA
jgi:alkanesulfonate monooxygenase SsuD/methylene tetrahydromethanopterin reductase-like flavin-dependent oxidoreductase (luciferase family)